MLYFLSFLIFSTWATSEDVSSTTNKPDVCRIFGAVYEEKDKSRAKYLVYEEETESFADVLIFEEENRLFADKSGIWYFVEERGMADFTVYFTDSRGNADFSVYFTDVVSFAGCK